MHRLNDCCSCRSRHGPSYAVGSNVFDILLGLGSHGFSAVSCELSNEDKCDDSFPVKNVVLRSLLNSFGTLAIFS